MPQRTGRELDTVSHQHVCGHELRKARQRPAPQLGHRTSFQQRPTEPVRRAHVDVREPRHDLTSHDTPTRCLPASRTAPAR